MAASRRRSCFASIPRPGGPPALGERRPAQPERPDRVPSPPGARPVRARAGASSSATVTPEAMRRWTTNRRSTTMRKPMTGVGIIGLIRRVWVTTGIRAVAGMPVYAWWTYAASTAGRVRWHRTPTSCVQRADDAAFHSLAARRVDVGPVWVAGCLVAPEAYAPLGHAVAARGLSGRHLWVCRGDARRCRRHRARAERRPATPARGAVAVARWVLGGRFEGGHLSWSEIATRPPRVPAGRDHRRLDASAVTSTCRARRSPSPRSSPTEDGIAPHGRVRITPPVAPGRRGVAPHRGRQSLPVRVVRHTARRWHRAHHAGSTAGSGRRGGAGAAEACRRCPGTPTGARSGRPSSMLPESRRSRLARHRQRASALLFVLFLFGGAEARGGPQRFAGIEERQASHVKGRRALRRLVGDNDDNRAAFHALAERDAATAGEPGVHETFEHLAR